MSTDFWNRVEQASQKKGVKAATFRQWRSRGHVPAKHHFELCQTAEDIGISLSLNELNETQPSQQGH